MLYREIIAVCSQIHTKHTVWDERGRQQWPRGLRRSNPAVGMDVSLLWVFCLVKFLDGPILCPGGPTECVCVCVCVSECDEVQH